MRHLLDIDDLSTEELSELLATGADISKNKEKYMDICHGKKLATLFFEPSTRTRLSFTAAMMELGGNVIGFSDPKSSSASKGECVSDTIRVVSNYADIIAMRHPNDGAPLSAAMHSGVPIINAGDGEHKHPTQTLADLMTIQNHLGKFDNLTIGMCGDLKYGRTVHSLIVALTRYKNVKFILISPEELKLPRHIKDIITEHDMQYIETSDMNKYMQELDVLYMTRVQQERFVDIQEYLRLKDSYILTADKLKAAKKSLCIMHPLPRLNEISKDVDDDPRACYFEQTLNGKYMRMALILKLLDEYKMDSSVGREIKNQAEPIMSFSKPLKCRNPHCITNKEDDLKQLFVSDDNKVYRCAYCEQEI